MMLHSQEAQPHARCWDALGAALLADNLITSNQLSEALELQKLSNQRLSEILSELKFVSDEAIAHTFSKHFHIPYIDIWPMILLVRLRTREGHKDD